MSRRTPTSRGLVAPLLAQERRHADLGFGEIRAGLERGEPGAWRTFVERYSATLYTIAQRLAGPQDREEIAQEVYMGILERLARDDFRILREFREEARFETYLFTAVRNEVARLRRKRAEERRRRVDGDDGDGPGGVERAADATAGFAESVGLDPQRVVGLLAESLSRLAPRERLVLRLRFQQGLPYRRLATLFEWKDTNAAAYEVCRILRKLDLLDRCRQRLGWGEPERETLLRGLRGWLRSDAEPAD